MEMVTDTDTAFPMVVDDAEGLDLDAPIPYALGALPVLEVGPGGGVVLRLLPAGEQAS